MEEHKNKGSIKLE